MRPTPWIAASVAAIVLAGCGGQHARRAASSAAETSASHDAIAADRTRGRDEDTVTPGGVEVQDAYDRQRRGERASGRIGTVGERARAGEPTAGALSTNSDPSRGGFPGTTSGAIGGSSAGGEPPSGGTEGSPGQSTGSPAGGDQPIPYAGSRTIDPRPYPNVPSGGNNARRGTGAPRPTRPGVANDRGADQRTFGIPYRADQGASTLPQSDAGSTIQGPEGPSTGPVDTPMPAGRGDQRYGFPQPQPGNR